MRELEEIFRPRIDSDRERLFQPWREMPMYLRRRLQMWSVLQKTMSPESKKSPGEHSMIQPLGTS